MFFVISISFFSFAQRSSYHGYITYFTLEWPINGLIVVFIVQTIMVSCKDLHVNDAKMII